MVNQFFILIDNRSEKYFEQLKNKNYNEKTLEILKKNKSESLWAIPHGHVAKDIWKNIRKNDLVFFGNRDHQIPYVGRLIKKDSKRYSGEIFNLDDIDAKQKNYFLFFEKLDKEKFFFLDFINRCEQPNTAKKIPGIYKLKNNVIFEKDQKSSISNPSQPKRKKYKPPQFNWNEVPKEPKGKGKFEVFRYIRDQAMVKELKEFYNHKCQICGESIQYNKNKFYSEVHHYKPLHEKGLDSKNNMIVLCPNHHTMFDFKILKIDLDLKTLLDKNGKAIEDKKITFKGKHQIDTENIESQLM